MIAATTCLGLPLAGDCTGAQPPCASRDELDMTASDRGPCLNMKVARRRACCSLHVTHPLRFPVLGIGSILRSRLLTDPQRPRCCEQCWTASEPRLRACVLAVMRLRWTQQSNARRGTSRGFVCSAAGQGFDVRLRGGWTAKEHQPWATSSSS